MNTNEIRHILDKIKYKDWHFRLGVKGEVMYLQVNFLAADPDEEELSWQAGRKWMLSEHMTKSEIVQTALKAVLTAEELEARERFRFEGHAVFAPHFDVDALQILVRHQHTDERPDPAFTVANDGDMTYRAVGSDPAFGKDFSAEFPPQKGPLPTYCPTGLHRNPQKRITDNRS